MKEKYVVIRANVSSEIMAKVAAEVSRVISIFDVTKRTKLKDVDKFLGVRYKAVKMEWHDINQCTKKGAERYNQHCKTVFCISEGMIDDSQYYSTYKILRENCVNPSLNPEDAFTDVVVILGSSDGIHATNYYVGGHSEGLLHQMHLLCGKHLNQNTNK